MAGVDPCGAQAGHAAQCDQAGVGRRPGDRAGAGARGRAGRARRNSPEAAAARLFAGIAELDEDAAGDPAALARGATRASGRAVTGRLWAARGRGDAWGQEPDEAAFEAVRRKVLGPDWEDREPAWPEAD